MSELTPWSLAAFGSNAPFVVLPASLSSSQTVVDPNDANASVAINRDGTYSLNGVVAGSWVEPRHATVGDEFDVKFARTAGSTLNGVGSPADDTYVQVNATRTFGNDQTSIGARTTTGTFSFSYTGASSAIATLAGQTIDATVTS